MLRSQLNPLPEYFDRYINLCDDIDILTAIQTSVEEAERFPLDQWRALGDRVYAPGKWTVKDILQHLIDTERIFSYRALAFARGEKQVPSFDEEMYAANAGANSRTLESLVDELHFSHQFYKKLFESFGPKALAQKGLGFKGELSVADMGFIMPGHQRWHMKVLEERYYPLL
jgi:DinB superfamily